MHNVTNIDNVFKLETLSVTFLAILKNNKMHLLIWLGKSNKINYLAEYHSIISVNGRIRFQIYNT